MSGWDELVGAATVGTGQMAPSWTAAPPALAGLLGQLDGADRELTLLRAAALIDRWATAGRAADAPLPAPAPAPPETLARCDDRASDQLAALLAGQHRGVLPEWLGLLVAAGQRVPEQWLPELLVACQRDPALAPLVAPALGERGRWLAAQNPMWSDFASLDDPAIWERGTKRARLAWYAQRRAADPAAARELLADGWPTEEPSSRAALLGTWQVGMSMADEPFLEAARADRRKEVRAVAVQLLAQLGDSRLVAEATARAVTALGWTPAQPATLLPPRLGKPAALTVALPDTFEPLFERLGFDEKPPRSEQLGKKAWWLQQLLALVPPSVWAAQWQTTPAALLDAAAAGAWAALLGGAWRAAAVNHRDETWAVLLIEHWLAQLATSQDIFAAGDDLLALPAVVSPASWERLALRWLDAAQPVVAQLAMLRLVNRGPAPWSAALSHAVVDCYRRYLDGDTIGNDWDLDQLLRGTTLLVDPSVARSPAAAALRAREGRRWENTLAAWLHTLDFRYAMHTTFKGAEQ